MKKATPATLRAEGGRPQSFLHIMLKAFTLAKHAYEAACAGYEKGMDRKLFDAFLKGMTAHRFRQMRTFVAWGSWESTTISSETVPHNRLFAFAHDFEKAIALQPALGSDVNDALVQPRTFMIEAYRALYHAHAFDLDVERVFPAAASEAT
jgi:hypothetical protein